MYRNIISILHTQQNIGGPILRDFEGRQSQLERVHILVVADIAVVSLP